MVLKLKTKILKLFSIILVLNILLSLTSGCMMNDTSTQLFVYCEDGLYRLSLSTDGKPQKEKVLSTEIEFDGGKEDVPFALPTWNAPYFFFPKKINSTFTSQFCYPSISNDGKKIIGFSGRRTYAIDCLDMLSWMEKIGSNKKFMLDLIFNNSIYDRNYCIEDAWFSSIKNEIFFTILNISDEYKRELWKTDLNFENKVNLTKNIKNFRLIYYGQTQLYPPVIISPDGKKVLLYSYNEPFNDLWMINSDGTEKRNIRQELKKEIEKEIKNKKDFEVGIKEALFTPDNRKIVMFIEVIKVIDETNYDTEKSIWIMNTNGTEKKELIKSSKEIIPSVPFMLTPGGKEIIFYTFPPKDLEKLETRGIIWIINIKGIDKKNLTVSLEKELETEYYGAQITPFINISPDGRKIVFEFEYYDETKDEVISSLGIANTDGSGARDLLKEAKEKYPELKESLIFGERFFSFFYPCFTPDSKNIIFISYGGPYLWIIDDEGKNIINLSKTFDLKIWSDFIETFIPGG